MDDRIRPDAGDDTTAPDTIPPHASLRIRLLYLAGYASAEIGAVVGAVAAITASWSLAAAGHRLSALVAALAIYWTAYGLGKPLPRLYESAVFEPLYRRWSR